MNPFNKDFDLSSELIEKFNKFGTLYIGADFDDTIRDFVTGDPIDQVITAIKNCNKLGLKVCLYTARESRDLVYALDYCEGVGIKIDYVNYSPLSPGLRKPLFNLLLDDRAGLVESVQILNEVLNGIKTRI